MVLQVGWRKTGRQARGWRSCALSSAGDGTAAGETVLSDPKPHESAAGRDGEPLLTPQRIILKVFQRYWRLTRGLTVGVQGLVLDEAGRVLLVRHGYRPGWHFPGGGVERNETAAAALERELREEAGVELTGEPVLFGIYANFRAFPSDHIVLSVVREWCQPKRPEPNAEIVEQGFFSRDNLPEGTIPGVRRRLAELHDRQLRSRDW